MRTATVVCLVTLAVAGCVDLRTTAVQRASRELRCPEAQVTLVNRPEIDMHVFDASGCGRVARYTCFHPHESGNLCAREPDPGPQP
jgi:hypothetical protein